MWHGVLAGGSQSESGLAAQQFSDSIEFALHFAAPTPSATGSSSLRSDSFTADRKRIRLLSYAGILPFLSCTSKSVGKEVPLAHRGGVSCFERNTGAKIGPNGLNVRLVAAMSLHLDSSARHRSAVGAGCCRDNQKFYGPKVTSRRGLELNFTFCLPILIVAKYCRPRRLVLASMDGRSWMPETGHVSGSRKVAVKISSLGGIQC